MYKSLLVISFITVFVAESAFAQTIRRVNNNPGITGVNVYTTIQAAHDAAVDGDILIVEPSTVSYGDLNATKRLRIYGNGYFLDANPELNVNPSSSIVGSLYFHAGSDSSEVSGMNVSSYIYLWGVNDVKVTRNNTSYIYIYGHTSASVSANADGNVISQNHVNYIYLSTSSSYGVISNTMINNNIINYTLSAPDQFKISNLIIRNNTFWQTSINIANAVFENNVYVPTNAITTYNTTVSYNVGSGTLPAGTGNQSNVTLTNEFLVPVNAGLPAGVSQDERWKVVDGSLLKTAGNGGIEVGAYGDVAPYVVSGITPRPTILNMVNSGSGSGAAPLDVTITIKSNN